MVRYSQKMTIANNWLIGKTRITSPKLGKSVIMHINAEGERLSKFTF